MFRLGSLQNKVPMEFLCIPELGTVPGTCQTLSKCLINWIPASHPICTFVSLIPLHLRESCRAAWCLAHWGPLTNVYWRIRHVMRITRQSLSDKLLINNSWSPGVLSQEVRVCWGSPWCGQGLWYWRGHSYVCCTCHMAWVGGLGRVVLVFCFCNLFKLLQTLLLFNVCPLNHL